MNNQRRNFRLTCALLAAVLAVGVAGCAQPAEDKQPQGKTRQLWIADNFVDPQDPKTAAEPGDEGGLAVLPRLKADAAGQK